MHARRSGNCSLLCKSPHCCGAPSGRSDNGGASFLGQVFAAVKGMAESQGWVLISVPRLHEPHLQLLAEAQGCDLPPLALPAGVPVIFPEGASPALVRTERGGVEGLRRAALPGGWVWGVGALQHCPGGVLDQCSACMLVPRAACCREGAVPTHALLLWVRCAIHLLHIRCRC